MPDRRLTSHPILPIPVSETITFMWCGTQYYGHQGETIAAALMANGIRIFGHHHKDHAPLGIFCANGQCSQCMVKMDGRGVKACVEKISPGCQIEPMDGLPDLPPAPIQSINYESQKEIRIPVLILGGGPAGLSAAIELGKRGVEAIIVDDKDLLGGKLVLQTHRFFGSINAVYAGTRGIEIAKILQTTLQSYSSIQTWTNSTCLAVFSDKKVGVLKDGKEYVLITPEVLLVATGAREKSLTFRGNTLPGVFGAGAFQTLLNRDLVKPSEKLFIVGGGNVGLIAGYHALQAGIQVVGLVEAAKECGGYKVHKDKLTRMGVPIYTSHTILSANGAEAVESVSIAQVDIAYRPIPGTERTYPCDTVLVAVGLDPVNEFLIKGRDFGMTVFSAGDAEEIAEASSAIFAGKIRGLEIASLLGASIEEIPRTWHAMASILKSRPGESLPETQPQDFEGVTPIIHCTQEIPCDPCSSICPQGLIYIEKSDIRSVPTFLGDNHCCGGCEKCLTICPGLAITLVDYQINSTMPLVSIPYEFHYGSIAPGDQVTVMDTSGDTLGEVEVAEVSRVSEKDNTVIVRVYAPSEYARRIAGIRVQEVLVTNPLDHYLERIQDDTIICRCERVTAGEIRELIRKGYRDLNEIKTVSRAMMGACGSKTCSSLIHRLFIDEGIDPQKIMAQTRRPIFIEVDLGIFAGANEEKTE